MTAPHVDDVDAELARIREKKRREAATQERTAADRPCPTERKQSQTGDTSLFSQFAAPAWPQMDEAAYHGLTGEVVQAIEPHSEADPNGILIQFLVAFGNAIGPTCYYQIEGDQHRAKLFVVTSGATSKGRKGTALGRIRQLMAIAAPDWEKGNIRSGLSSGEGSRAAIDTNADGDGERFCQSFFVYEGAAFEAAPSWWAARSCGSSGLRREGWGCRGAGADAGQTDDDL
jgi:hypothetical protein